MQQEARKQLIEIVKKYGIKILDEPRKVEGLLRDFCGDCKKEIFSIVNALKEGSANDLASSTKGNTTKLVVGRLCKKLQDDLALSEEASIWSIQSIAIALGIMSEKEARGIVKKVKPPTFEQDLAMQSSKTRGTSVDNKHNEPVTSTKPQKKTRYRNQSRDYKGFNGDEFILIESGSFKMGDTLGDGYPFEKPAHVVILTYDFYMGKYPVTFLEYERYCKATGVSGPENEGWGRRRRPVINVSWNDAIKYCNWLSDNEKLPKAYDSNGNLLDKDGKITTDPSKVIGYRLPTEAEWEYAARGGKNSKGYKYSGSNSPDSVAWYESNSGNKTHEVGQKKGNELGLYDMNGNVWEWCSDMFGSYSNSLQTNPFKKSGSQRVKRGGSWNNDVFNMRLAGRSSGSPNYANNDLGFRICRKLI